LSINEALAKPASIGTGKPGMVIYVAPGEYAEDVVIAVSNTTLPAVSVIGMSDDDQSSKRVQITGSFTIGGTGTTDTINTVVLNNIEVSAKNSTTSAVAISGIGIRVYLKNGLYTNSNASATANLITLASLPTADSALVNQLIIDDCSCTLDNSTASGHIVSVASGQLFSVIYSDLTNVGSGLAVSVNGGFFGSANNSNFESRLGSAISLQSPAAALTSFTTCLIKGKASPSVAIVTLATNANLNLTDSTVQNTNTTEANNTSRYVYLTAGVLVSAIRNNFSSSASPAITSIAPFQSTTPASSILFYFANIYTNASNTIKPLLPVWASVQQFSNDLLIPQFQPIATSGTAIPLTASLRGKTFILTGTTTQAFSTAALTATDAGFGVNVRNGNGTLGGDITITGATGNTVIHNQTAVQNGQTIVLYWTGSALVAY
jgi:hypothetical protein